MEDQSPVTGKPTRRGTGLLGLRENNVIYIVTDINSVIILSSSSGIQEVYKQMDY